MTMLQWNSLGERGFETGVDRGVLYLNDGTCVVWNGLTAVDQKPAGAGATAYYLDGVKYLNDPGDTEFAASLSAVTYPDQFAALEGMVDFGRGLSIDNQPRQTFGLSYRTLLGNDTDGSDYGYIIHLIYNCLAEPSTRNYTTVGSSITPVPFSWDISTTPVKIFGSRQSAHFQIDSTKTGKYLLAQIEEILYGSNSKDGRMPSAVDLIGLFASFTDLSVIDNGNGILTISGPDDLVYFDPDDPTTMVIDSAQLQYSSADPNLMIITS